MGDRQTDGLAEAQLDRAGLLAIIDHLPLAVAVLDADRRILLANHTAAKLANDRREALIGQVGGKAFKCRYAADVPEGCGFGPRCQRCLIRLTALDTLVNRKANSLVEATLDQADGARHHLRVTCVPLDLEGRPVALLALEDITEQKRREALARQHEQLKAAVATGGAVCHEMNQPLQVLMATLDLILEDDTYPDVAGRLATMRAQVERLAEVTRKLTHMNTYATVDYVGDVQILDLDGAQPDKPA